MTKTKVITKPAVKSAEYTMFTKDQMERRMFALTEANRLVQNPVHVLSATPDNIMALANQFYMFIEGVTPVSNTLSTAKEPAQKEMAYA